jgi:hypothetical protein
VCKARQQNPRGCATPDYLKQQKPISASIAELDLILADYDVRTSASRSIPIDQLNASNDD